MRKIHCSFVTFRLAMECLLFRLYFFFLGLGYEMSSKAVARFDAVDDGPPLLCNVFLSFIIRFEESGS